MAAASSPFFHAPESSDYHLATPIPLAFFPKVCYN